MLRRVLITLGLLMALAATAAFLAPKLMMARHSFSQHPGFDGYFRANPPATELPSAQDQDLLRRHRPHIFASANSAPPIDFYADYIAHGELRRGNGTLIGASVTPQLLNAHKTDPGVVFTHIPPPQETATTHPVVYGRIDRATFDLGSGPEPLTLLTYNLVFRHSGLPAGLPAWQAWPLSWIADLDDWHQLDHYTAATVVLDKARQPVALMLQQHNYHRTYLFGEGISLGSDGRAEIDIAERSNELYPHAEAPGEHRAASFIDPESWRYLIGAKNRYFFVVTDRTVPSRKIDYELGFLSPSDAFYTFAGFLGARRALPGRDGPPGANYKTLPQFLPVGTQLPLGYWREGNRNDIGTLEGALAGKSSYVDFADRQARVLRANLACIRRWQGECALQ